MLCVVCGQDVDPRAPAFLIECHFCGRWLHGTCVQVSEQDALLVAKFACTKCQQHGHEGVKYQPVNNDPFDADAVTFSPLPVHLGGYASSSSPVQLRHKKSSPSFRRVLGAAIYARSGVHLVPCQDFQPSFLQRNALEEPVLIAANSHRAAGLDVPFPVLDATSTADLLTSNRVVRTIDVATQTRQHVVLLEMQHDALAQYWSETTAGWLSVDANVQLWTAVCYYVRQLLMINNGMNAQVSDLDRRALQRALPRLREWSALPASLKSVSGITWTPSSQREAQAIVGRLEQALAATCLPTHSLDDLQPTSGLGNDSKLPPISPNEATYIYSAASVPDSMSGSPWVATSTGFDSTNAPMGTMWSNFDPTHHHHQQDHLVISTQNQPYSNSDPSFQQHSPNQNLPGYGSSDYGYLPGMAGSERYIEAGSHDLGLEGLSSIAASGQLGAPMATSFQQPRVDSNGNYVDMLMRHRASCHRCGNLRKKNVRCPVCPHIFCAKCAEKMVEEHGEHIFEGGCPVCKELCCCGKNRTTRCTRKFHCYKKCPSTKRPASGSN
ncbi:hypothetical protein AM588_10004869 [Phytophthora nicotianae]|uniref:RING-type domain-containing protein n=1 Tax=Phytophthora nicotianae TaxID=4792 RepID=A0A0W8DEE8_PHYNI|nr:hypothetical protein AM588_10004869 [Phytophthora nicotianae]